MNCYTREQIEDTMKRKGYKYFTGGGKDYDVNIIGVRNSEVVSSFFVSISAILSCIIFYDVCVIFSQKNRTKIA